MTSDEERREAAKRIRNLAKAVESGKLDWTVHCKGREVSESLAIVRNACGITPSMSAYHMLDRLASIIEPAPERTCRMRHRGTAPATHVLRFECSRCGVMSAMDCEPRFCPDCGARVEGVE